MAELDRAGISARMGQSLKQAGLTQPEIADLMLVHFRTVQEWVSPKRKVVPFDRIDEWARLTNVSREWLLYGEEAEDTDRLAAIEEELRGLREELAAVRATLPVVEEVLGLARDLQALLRERADTS
jgi:transcriptional regulator with XRE-family HTH domain